MNSGLVWVLALLVSAVVMFALNRPRMDAVALLMIVALPFTGVVTVPEVLSGFSDPNIVLIAALFVIGDGLVRTGVAQRMGDFLCTHAGQSETRLLVLLMTIVALIGSVMSSTGVVAIFIPVVLRICHNAGVAPGKLMMPLSIAALISGMMTLVATTPNLVINAELVREGHAGFSFFSFTPFGLPILVAAIAFMLLVRRWLPGEPEPADAFGSRPRLAQWVEEYALKGRAYRLRLPFGAGSIGQTMEEWGQTVEAGVNVIAIERSGRLGRVMIRPQAQNVLQAEDGLLVDVSDPAIRMEEVAHRLGLEVQPLSDAYFSDRLQEIGLAEVMIPPGSNLVGSTILKSAVRSRFGLTVIGLKQGRKACDDDILRRPLRVGDTLLVAGLWSAIKKAKADIDDMIVCNLPAEFDEVVPAASRSPYAVATLALVVGLMVVGWIPNVQAALIGCLLMGLFGCVSFTSAYRSIHWQGLVLIVGMLPFSLALQRTGGIDLAANAFLQVAGEASPRLVLGGLFVITAVLGLFISNTATAVLMAPVAMAIARDMQVSPYPFAMTVALASSAAFMTPVSSPVNTLVVGPGNYTFMDFVRIGVPFTVLTLLITVILVPWLLPL